MTDIEVEEQDKILNTLWLIEFKHLTQGHSFGELSLIRNAPRAATITCASNCSFAVMSKSDYDRVLMKIE